MKSHQITPVMYAMEWFTTLFAYSLPPATCWELWDLLILKGISMLYLVGVAILVTIEEEVMAAHPEKVLEVLREHTWRLTFGQIKEACMRLARDPPNTELYSHTQSSLTMSRPLQVHLTPDSKSRKSDGVMVPPPRNGGTPTTERSWLGEAKNKDKRESDSKGKRRGSGEFKRNARNNVVQPPRKVDKNAVRRRSTKSDTTPLAIAHGRGAGGWALAGIGGPGSGGSDFVERSATNSAAAFT
eukprot:CAMPEP_0170184224 /NCGR_PEP_ID=MMETSP0040_2-20121228/33026_1 /TAXON_ID=641309 /ORGANISM="Lotharella oceanica, Strain CCMP622" /LENGTH=241 /DNA_ID=CAMNT_0010430203 /DNA_START=246 /DNA_END=971 /DNA_ORIENTATION=-